MAEVEKVCDRVIFVNNGKIIADGTPATLARSIETSHLKLRIDSGMEKAAAYCDRLHVSYRSSGAHIVIDLSEKRIPEFLRDLMGQGITYDEISIQEASLEDYFLQVAHTNFSEKI